MCPLRCNVIKLTSFEYFFHSHHLGRVFAVPPTMLILRGKGLCISWTMVRQINIFLHLTSQKKNPVGFACLREILEIPSLIISLLVKFRFLMN